MALVTTVTPTVSTEDHIPGIPDSAETLAGNIDRNDIEGWGYDSTFAFPTPHFSITPDWGTPATDIGSGTVYRLESDGQKKHVIESETGVSLSADSKNYVYYTQNDEYEVHDADEPPSGQAVLIAILNTTTNTVNTEVRGRTPLPLDFLSPVSGGGAAESAPIVSTGDADAVADTTAELSGILDSLGGADSVDVYIQWREAGTGNAWNETTKEAQSTTGPFNANVTGLTAGTQYEFRGVALNPNQANLVGFGITKTFTTTNDGTTQASVTTDAATNITASSVDMNGTLNDLGDDSGTDRSSVDVFFDYESVDGSEASSSGGQTLSATGSFSETVSGLRQDTRYRYRAAARYSGETVYGGWVEFTTSAGTALAVTTDSATNIGQNEATLNGTMTSFGGAQSASVNFNYRIQGRPTWNQTTIETITTTLGFLETVDQLVSGTTYEFQARASTSTDTATGTVETFETTGPSPNAVVVDDFEDGDLDGWSYTGSDVENDDTVAVEGSRSQHFTTTTNRFSEKQFTRGAYDTFWLWYRQTRNDDQFILNLIDSVGGDTIVAIDIDGTTVSTFNTNNIGSITNGDWYKFYFTSIDYASDTYTLQVEDVNGSVQFSHQEALTDSGTTEIDTIRVSPYDSEVWVDYIVAGP